MSSAGDKIVMVIESGKGPYAQFVTAGHHVMAADEPQQLGGRDSGPSPYEYLLAGLGACTAMTLCMYTARHNWPLRRVTVTLRHEAVRTADKKVATDRFLRNIELSGDLNGEQRAKLLDIAARCPVSRTLQHPSQIVTELSPKSSRSFRRALPQLELT
jgi:putative redox protein